ncbi:MAG TPA: hypothetical protein VE713_16680 [Pyrinomonadaceae bacterium]|jgi:hypothetical protein|nr:hypothetical protein [Pyrinomonadaceae bacterium]
MKKKSLLKLVILAVILLAVGLFLILRQWGRGPKPGTVPDEARRANRAASSFPAADEDYFRDMDGKVSQQPDEYFQDLAAALGVPPGDVRRSVVKGRNTWLVWTGGNDRFWDKIGVNAAGALDFLKTLSSYDGEIDPKTHEHLKFSRDNRWSYLGLVNEPCFEKAKGPDPERFGLWLDRRIVSPECPPDPFENESKYPGVVIGSRGKDLPAGRTEQYLPKKMPVGSFYGYATGIVGLRLFPNPDFDEKAARNWDPKRFYSDPDYYYSKDLVRPYRVGMSCAFCHVGPDPVHPPADPENPKWENLNNSVGAQYFWVDRIFDWRADPSSYVFQMFHTSRPGTLDTSLVSTDNINNPRTMNAIYNLGPRLEQARVFGKETLSPGSPGSRDNKQLNDYVPAGSPLARYFIAPDTVYAPRVLKDGADSVGALGALNRVYLNIGLFSEEWTLHFNPLVGGKTVTPISIADARKNSSYWEATEAQTTDLALFFLKATAPHKLKDAPGGEAFLTKDEAVLNRGKEVFADTCARCHSSKLPKPDKPLKIFQTGGCSGPDYFSPDPAKQKDTCWGEYWEWTKTPEFKTKMREIVMAPDFLDGNYLSAEHRVPVTLLQTNACSPLATNAIRGNIWDNFSSETYKDLSAVGQITVYQPQTGEPRKYDMPGGGRGYTRPASLISLWSTAPFLLNNTVGRLDPDAPNDDYNPNPSVEKRMHVFQDAIEKMLWPEKREKDPTLERIFRERGIQDFPGVVDRTTQRSYLRVAPGYLPDALKSWGPSLFPGIFDETDGIEIGPIPPGTPVSLLASLNVRPEGLGRWERFSYDRKILGLVKTLKGTMKEVEALGPNPTDAQVQEIYARGRVVDQLMELSKCQDYIVNRGHYFGTGFFKDEPGLSDDDKRALIEFLKTF